MRNYVVPLDYIKEYGSEDNEPLEKKGVEVELFAMLLFKNEQKLEH